MKCEKCGYISFDYNYECPVCNKDLGTERSRLGLSFNPPEADFEELFTGQSGTFVSPSLTSQPREPEIELDSVGEEFEFTLDD